MCNLNDTKLRKKILRETHYIRFVMHPTRIKIYRNLQKYYWWKGMKWDIAEFVSRYLTCQQMKVEYQKPRGSLQPLLIPK